MILTGAAHPGRGRSSSLLLLVAYALGAATSLGSRCWSAARLFRDEEVARRERSGYGEVLGVRCSSGVVAIALGLDTSVLSKFSFAKTASLEGRSLI